MSETKRYKHEAVATARVVTEVEKVKLYLTFDDGPNDGTHVVLDVLNAEAVKATFFMNAIHMSGSPSQQYSLVKRMIDEGHGLANHGYDHDPMSTDKYKRTPANEVKDDFTMNLSAFQKLFRENKDVFPGFVAARLPGDGRFLPKFVNMITDEVKLSHVGWGHEFCPAGTFPKREKLPLLEEHKLEESKPGESKEQTTKHQQANEQIKRENEQIRAENAQIKKDNEENRDFYQNWIAGVSGTLPPGRWPPADSIVLLHDLHWKSHKALLQKLIQELKQTRTITHLMPLPLHKDIKVASSKGATKENTAEAGTKPADTGTKPADAGTKPAELFFVQIGSMSSERAADELRSKAIAAGHTNTIVTAKDKQWRVRIGPYDSMQMAREASVEIGKKFAGAFPVSQ